MQKIACSLFLASVVFVLSACGNGGSSGSNGTEPVPAPAPTLTYSVGGSISGFSSGSLVLSNNAGDSITIAANTARFTFPTPINNGAAYAVTVSAQPSGLTCAVSNGSGTINSANVTDVSVVCAVNTYTLGGTVTGLSSGTLSLQNNAGSSLNVTSSGVFAFPEALPDGSAYNVTVSSQPSGLACAVSNGAGSVSGANVSNVSVACGSTTLISSVSSMALAVNGVTRVLTVTNTGSMVAQGLTVNAASPLPSGSTLATTCTSTLAPGASCNVSIAPGSTASGAAGAAPTPSAITIGANNANTVTLNASVLRLGNIYQGGYIFAIDDTTSVVGSIGGKVAALTDQSGSIAWGGVGTAINGINENSTTPCDGRNDGQCNSVQIVTALAGTPLTSYAAGLCTATISGYSDWYLPSICELGPDAGAGTSCAIGTPNMQTNLVANGIGGFGNHGDYWSSTQSSVNPANLAWYQFVDATGLDGQFITSKSAAKTVRCARTLMP